MFPIPSKEEMFGDLNPSAGYVLTERDLSSETVAWAVDRAHSSLLLKCAGLHLVGVVRRRDGPTVHKGRGGNRCSHRGTGGEQPKREGIQGREIEKKSPEMSPPRRSPPAAAAAVLLLLFAVFFCSPAAAACGGACATDLQKHAAFFDGNGDGIVSFSETYNALRSLGFGFAISSAGAAFINGALGTATKPENASSSFTDIYIEYIHKGIHGSDTGSYDAEGMFVPEKFDEIFAKHAKTVPNALTSDEIDEMLRANREPGNYKGWAGAEAEWKILYSLAADQNGLLHKEDVRDVYDGSLFYRKLQERRSGHRSM
ncbi:hypothetical protein ACP70R_027755 [Stipagrostis hirtigluma subsp. patula]